MNRNRFEFLELGEDGGEQPQRSEVGQGETDEPVLQGRDPVAERGPDGEPLAQVRESDVRGYRNFLVPEQDMSEMEKLRNRLRVTPGTLRAAEVFGERGTLAGQFMFPAGLAVDSQGVLFVADSYNHRVQRITPDGGVSPLGGRGAARGQFLSPQDVATDRWDSFYIVEQGNHRVQKFGTDGTLLMAFGKLGVREGEFRGPTGIAVAPGSGDIYVADAGNNRVQRFNSAGYYLLSLTSPGGMEPFNPQAVAVDQEDNAHVADPFSGRVWRFDARGRAAGWVNAPFTQPRALACGEDSLLYVADAGMQAEPGLDPERSGRIQALHSMQSRVLATVEQAGRRLGGLARPGGLAIAPRAGDAARGDLYVADTRNHRILRFTWE